MSDIKLFLTKNGTELKFIGGRPKYDHGLENAVLISLFTKKGWFGNDLGVEIGSDFEKTCNESITKDTESNIRISCLEALNWLTESLCEKVECEVKANRIINITIKLYPKGFNGITFEFTKDSANWIYQIKEGEGQ